MTPVISIINESTVMQDADLAHIVAALQIQVARDFAPEWGGSATLQFVPKGQVPVANTWQLVVLDNTDQAGDLGYHDLTASGLPMGKVFAATDQQYGLMVSVTVSHELLEMLADPWINQAVYRETARSMVIFPQEICDAVEDDQFSYQINGVAVSDFVFQAWFHNHVEPGTKLDYQGVLTEVCPNLAAGGYIGELDVIRSTGWKQIFGQHTSHDRGRLNRARGRLDKRMRPSDEWKRSTKHA